MPIQHLTDMFDASLCRRLVIKVGSALLIGAEGHVRQSWLDRLTRDIAALRNAGQQIIVVSSGAIAIGSKQIDMPVRMRRSLADAQAAASIGQIALAGMWSRALAAHGITAAQMLVTLDDLEDRRRYLNASATLERLVSAGVVPVINENDSIATTEIRFGDNDRLAARMAQAGDADAVLLLSDVDGLYDRHPDDQGAQLVPIVRGVDGRIAAMADDGGGTEFGSGGMGAKLQAAQIAERAGIALGIVNGIGDAPLQAARETGRGTVFLPIRSDPARKAWIGGRLTISGRLTLDDGCVAVLRGDGASVLAAGIMAVEGEFARGDLVELIDADGTIVAQGLSEYDAAEMRAIAGLRHDAQHSVLGYAPRSAAVHRNQMVPLW